MIRSKQETEEKGDEETGGGRSVRRASYGRHVEHTPRFVPKIGRSDHLYEVARPVNQA